MGGVSCASVLSHPTYFLPMEVQDGASTDTGSRVAVPRAGGDARIGVKAEDLGYRKSSKTGCVPAELGLDTQASSCLRKGTPLSSLIV